MIVAGSPPLGAVTIVFAVAGYAVGPDFRRPAAPTDTGYTREPLVIQTGATDARGGEAQHLEAEQCSLAAGP